MSLCEQELQGVCERGLVGGQGRVAGITPVGDQLVPESLVLFPGGERSWASHPSPPPANRPKKELTTALHLP